RAVSGDAPFDLDPEDPTRAITLLSRGPVPAASAVVKSLGPEADRFFSRAFAKSADDRFQSARELADAFAAFAGAAGPTEAPPESASRPAQRTRDGASTGSLPMPLVRQKDADRGPGTVSDTVPEGDPRFSRPRIALLVAVGGLAVGAAVL